MTLQWTGYLSLLVFIIWFFIWGFNLSISYFSQQEYRMKLSSEVLAKKKQIELEKLSTIAKAEAERVASEIRLEVEQARLGHEITKKDLGLEQVTAVTETEDAAPKRGRKKETT